MSVVFGISPPSTAGDLGLLHERFELVEEFRGKRGIDGCNDWRTMSGELFEQWLLATR